MKLSIIIPIRNEEFLIKKIINQLQSKLKISSYEVIFINDFSTDNTTNVTKELIKTKPQINIYDNNKKGLGGAITQGIYKATGEAVCIMMSDLSDSIEDLESYRYPERNDGQPLKDAPLKDGYSEHGADCLRYGVINRFPIRKYKYRTAKR